MSRTAIRTMLGSALLGLTAAVAMAQTTATTETKKFEIIAVEGNQLVVRLPEGTREMTVPSDFMFNVDGRMLSVRELKPGMAGTATVTTKTTLLPVTVTEVKNGTVVQTMGGSIIVRTDEGFKSFTQGEVDKRGVKIMKDGKPAQISDFRANDRLSAVIITSRPPQVLTEQQVQATLARSGAGPSGGAPAAGAAAGAGAGAQAASRQASAGGGQAAAGGGAKQLPKTASPLPLLGLMGLASLLTGLGLTTLRRRAAR